MANVLGDEKKQQVLALGRLGWPLRRIEDATGVRRETAGAYLKAAGIAVRPARTRRPPPKPASEVSTDSGGSAKLRGDCGRRAGAIRDVLRGRDGECSVIGWMNGAATTTVRAGGARLWVSCGVDRRGSVVSEHGGADRRR